MQAAGRSRWSSAIDAARRDADFVAGVVLIEGRTPFERALALTHYPSPAELHDPGLFVRISHRLFGRGYDPDRVGRAYMAFSKAVWSAVGGFPDELSASEDHAFSSEVVARGFRFARAREAAVRWSPPGSCRQRRHVSAIRAATSGSGDGSAMDPRGGLAAALLTCSAADGLGASGWDSERRATSRFRAPSARRPLPAAALVADPAGGRAQGPSADRGLGGGRSRRHQGAPSGRGPDRPHPNHASSGTTSPAKSST